MTQPDKMITGWCEYGSLPELGLERLKAKIDTGAQTSALHAFDITPFKRDDTLWVRFRIHHTQLAKHVKSCECEVVDQRWVKSSNGQEEERIVICTEFAIGGQSWPIELTLTNRQHMRYPMLVGRAAMVGHLVVDPSARYLLSKPS